MRKIGLVLLIALLGLLQLINASNLIVNKELENASANKKLSIEVAQHKTTVDLRYTLLEFIGYKQLNEYFSGHIDSSNDVRKLTSFSNPNDKYEPSSDVKAGHRFSGEDFGTTQEYFMSLLPTPIGLLCAGLLSIIFLNIFLCCRVCCKCLVIQPNDHSTKKGHENDTYEKRKETIKYQKKIIFWIEMGLCFIVFLCDTMSFIGRGRIVNGGTDLTDAITLVQNILRNGANGFGSLKTTASTMNTAIIHARDVSCKASKANDPTLENNIENIYSQMIASINTMESAMKTTEDLLLKIVSYGDSGKTFINDNIESKADTFFFVLWSFALISVVLILFFRYFRSTWGTKFAVLWSELTFVTMLGMLTATMLIVSLLGDFCMNPSYSAVINSPAAVRPQIEYFATCQGSDQIDSQIENITLQTKSITDLFSEGSEPLSDFCSTSGTNSENDMKTITASLGDITAGVKMIVDALTCTALQAVWFKIMNDALCTSFYGG
jgi:hypothetical protein